MAITDRQVAVLRALLAGDFDEHDRQAAELDGEQDKDYGILIAAAFFEAVDRRFANGHTRADIVKFVADARERFDESGDVIDPLVAERLVLSVFEDVPADDLNDETVVHTQVVLLGELVTAQNLNSAAIDEFVSAARKLADEWALEK